MKCNDTNYMTNSTFYTPAKAVHGKFYGHSFMSPSGGTIYDCIADCDEINTHNRLIVVDFRALPNTSFRVSKLH